VSTACPARAGRSVVALGLIALLLAAGCTAPAAPSPAPTSPSSVPSTEPATAPAAVPPAPAVPAAAAASAPLAAVPSAAVPSAAQAADPVPPVPVPADAGAAKPDGVAATGEPTSLPGPAGTSPEAARDDAATQPGPVEPEAGAPPGAAGSQAPEPAATTPPIQEPATAEPEPAPALPLPVLVKRTDGVKVVTLDPGHGGPESGAVHATANGGRELIEKNVNLAIALRLRDLLEAEGYAVALTRDTDRAVHPANTGGGYRGGGLVQDLQRRIDIANEAGSDLFLSIHHNGSEDRGVSGAEVWYNKAREFADRNRTFAELTLQHLLTAVRGAGYPLVSRGVKDDEFFRIWQGRAFNIFVLGPGTGARPHVPTLMPGVLVEGAFVSNDGDARMLARPEMQQVIAQAYADAIRAYFARFPE